MTFKELDMRLSSAIVENKGKEKVNTIIEKDGYGAYSYGIADTDNDVLYIPRDAMEGKIENFNLEQDAWNQAAFRELIERVMPERMEYLLHRIDMMDLIDTILEDLEGDSPAEVITPKYLKEYCEYEGLI